MGYVPEMSLYILAWPIPRVADAKFVADAACVTDQLCDRPDLGAGLPRGRSELCRGRRDVHSSDRIKRATFYIRTLNHCLLLQPWSMLHQSLTPIIQIACNHHSETNTAV